MDVYRTRMRDTSSLKSAVAHKCLHGQYT